MNGWIGILYIIGTIIVYVCMKQLYNKVYTPVLVPTATSTLILVIALSLFQVDYDTYMIGGKWIEELLGPAVVALAYPLYRNRHVLVDYKWPIAGGVIMGSMIGIVSGILLSIVWRVDDEVIRSLAQKSVTSPVAMDIAMLIEGSPSLAAVYVMVAGITGAMVGPHLLKKLNINHYISVGTALGSASHGIGTAKALELSPETAAISSISMTLSAIVTVMLCPILIQWIL
ncbi:LrgB family protein [Metabacillus iocasae]|uniref:Murein hydrolase (TIGR00659 family) n=1 Tax=Priestia iocasae TaxID=2291674 RepID=A0ABS2R2A2_9BACI|nr:LrgB family protein [Metabacillus iocasae]MBM7704869.1 putative murein hydrolase (TIGR00659 family) [Metabacillus iocasae]